RAGSWPSTGGDAPGVARVAAGGDMARKQRNPGWFKKGHDARRSTYRFTAQDCRIGYWVACIKHPHLRDWLKMKILVYYHAKGKSNVTHEEPARERHD